MSFVLGRRMLPVTITAYGVMVIIVGFTRVAVLAGALIFVAGMLWLWTATTFNSSVQVQAPRWVRGRVVSLYVVAQGMQPVGAFMAGAIAEVTGAGPAIVGMASISVVLGVLGFRLRLPVLGELSEPEPAPERSRPLSVTHAERVGGSPVVVLNTFKVDGGRVDEFLEVMRRLRRERLRTGATKWALFRDAGDPWVMTEMFEVPDWEEHLAQHARIDARAAAVIRRARGFDVGGGPVSRHLAGVDVSGRSGVPLADQLVTVHARMHDDDGSVPLADSHDSNEVDRENASGHSEQSGSVGDDSDQLPGARSQRE
jgi:quinol monooxygenase YgiN